MSALNRYDAGALLDKAIQLRLTAHKIRSRAAKSLFLDHATSLEEGALSLLGADERFHRVLAEE